MNVEVFPHDSGFRVVATNAFGESEEAVIPRNHPVSEYVAHQHRLNTSYLVYWLTEKPSKSTDGLLKFLNRSNDGFRKRRVRSKGWEKSAGISTGLEADRPAQSRRPGDVVVHGNVAELKFVVQEVTSNGE